MYQSSPEKRKQMKSYGRIMDDITCIIDCGYMGSLFLGNIESACDIGLLNKQRITAILSICVSKIPFSVSSQMKQYQHIILEDAESENIYRYFNSSFEFIERGRQSGNVLVHCMAGISRSAALVAAYLMKKHNMTSKEALLQLERKRWQVYPNDGFVKQLFQYEKELNNQKQEIPYDWNGRMIKTSTSDNSTPNINQHNENGSISNEYFKIRKKYLDDGKQLDSLQKSTQYQLQQQRKTQFEILNNGLDIQIKRLQQISDGKRMLSANEPKQYLNSDNQHQKRALMDAINNFRKISGVSEQMFIDTSVVYSPKKVEFSSKYQSATTRNYPASDRFKIINNQQQKLENLLNQFSKKSKYQYK